MFNCFATLTCRLEVEDLTSVMIRKWDDINLPRFELVFKLNLGTRPCRPS